jgi:hypothetical protein
MSARIMISSVTKDQVPLGNIETLKDLWYAYGSLTDRLKQNALGISSQSLIPFTFIRRELHEHLEAKYGFDVYTFEDTPAPGRSPEEETLLEARKSHLVLGIFGSKTGWKVPDQDPLTPTLREWRAALQTPLKFRMFILKGSVSADKLSGPLGDLMKAVTDYKKGKVFMQFADAAELFRQVDDMVRDYLNRAVIRYALDTVTKEPTSESEKWLLSPYRARVREMDDALERVSRSLGVERERLQLADHEQPVALHSVPDNFSIAESRKFAAYIFDDEIAQHEPDELGKLHVIAVFGGVTDLQIRRHLGSLEAVEVYPASWGLYANEPAAGIQCVFLPRCTNSLIMESKMSQAVSWLSHRAREIAALAERRRQILDLLSGKSRRAKAR